MNTIQSTGKKAVFSLIAFVMAFALLNGVAWLISRKASVFWQNPLMVMYPVDHFDEKVTIEQYNFNANPNRSVRYVPDRTRWYRLNPEPMIPEGKVILNFGDSSTWGWGLRDRANAYPLVLDQLFSPAVHSVNLGIPGYSSLQGLRYMQELLPKYHDRVVGITLYFGNNDCVENGSRDSEKLIRERSLPIQCVRWFPLGRLMHDALVRIGQRSNQSPRVSPDEYEGNLRAMVALARSYQIPVVIIEPPRHFSWAPAHLKYTVSLRDHVQNRWTKRQLVQSERLYEDGLRLIYAKNDKYEGLLQEALEHDWVIPRIKASWLQRLSKVAQTDSVPCVRLPEVFVEAESYAFEDYCHPSQRVHAHLAREIGKALGF